MAAHLRKAAVEEPVFASENRIHRRFHIMGWTPPLFCHHYGSPKGGKYVT
jgi:hypothetical protein